MSYDIYTEYSVASIEAFQRILNDDNLDLVTKIKLLSASNIVEDGENDKEKEGKELIRNKYKEMVHQANEETSSYDRFCERQIELLKRMCLWQDSKVSLTKMPSFSFAIQFSFELAYPFMSRDDKAFYIIDNPVKKDKVFQVPYISGSTWKGNLRHAAMTNLISSELSPQKFADQRFRLTMLFGDERGEGNQREEDRAIANFLDEAKKEAIMLYREKVNTYFSTESEDALPNHQGRLRFYPTFFSRMDLEVINPHNRERKVGTVPIMMECVPKESKGLFQLLYIPYDLPANNNLQAKQNESQSVFEDLKIISDALEYMATKAGFGAKTSSGFGIIEDAFPKTDDGKLGGIIRLKDDKAKIVGYRFNKFEALNDAVQKIAEKLEVGDE